MNGGTTNEPMPRISPTIPALIAAALHSRSQKLSGSPKPATTSTHVNSDKWSKSCSACVRVTFRATKRVA